MNRLLCGFVSAVLLYGAAVAQNLSSGQAAPGLIRVQSEPGNPSQILSPTFTMMLQEGREGWVGGPEGEVRFFSMHMAGNQVVKNAPYTATATTESTQTLADGNRIVNKSSAFLARDGQGRTRREETIQRMGPLAVEGPKLVLIADPVAQADYVLQPGEQSARVIKHDESAEGMAVGMRKKMAARSRAFGATEPLERKPVTHEDLGMQDIEGVACQGKRETVTIPAGQMGNERPIAISVETWSSADLHVIVAEKHSDPRSGETVYRLTNIKLGEPDASLFQVPSGYKITKPEPMMGSKD